MSDYKKQDRRIESLQPIAQEAIKLLIKEAEKLGIKVFITETLRSQERQMYLYCQGRSVDECVKAGIPKQFATNHCRNGIVVTWTLNSKHATGMAVDFACSPPQELYDEKILDRLNALAESLGLGHGGSYGDSPHIEVPKNWRIPMRKLAQHEELALNNIMKKLSLSDTWREDLDEPVTRIECYVLLNRLLEKLSKVGVDL